jgi:two-component system, NarL family, response regulator LiaR
VPETIANMDSRTRVLLVGDHAASRAARRARLSTLSELEIVGAADGGEAQRLIGDLHPDVVIIDLENEHPNGMQTAWRAAKLTPRPRIIVVSSTADKERVRQALLAGATGYVLKDGGEGELESAVSAVREGRVWLSPAVRSAIVDDFVRSVRTTTEARPAHSLTPRQLEVLQLIAEGQPTKLIAKRLKISVKTVETHRAQIMERLEIRHIAGLVRYALRMGIVSPDE